MFAIDDLDLNLDEDFLDPDFPTNSASSTPSSSQDKSHQVFRLPSTHNKPTEPPDTRLLDSRQDDVRDFPTNSASFTPRSSQDKSHNLFRLPSTHNKPTEPPDTRLLESRQEDVPISDAYKQPVLRKFPGPAGLLPDKPPRSFNDSSITLEHAEDRGDDCFNQPILCSQTSEIIFSEPPFKRLKKDLNMDTPTSPLNTYTVGWVKKRTSNKGLRGRKIPFLAVVLQTVDCSSADPVVTLRDPTGELTGILHREVWIDMKDKLLTGAAIVLKQVGVLSTGMSRRQVVLNITMNNIVTVYSPLESGGVAVNAVQPISSTDLVQTITDWQASSSTPNSDNSRTRTSSPDSSNLFQVVSKSSLTPKRTSPPKFRAPRPFVPEQKEHGNVRKLSNDDTVSNFELFEDDDEFELSVSLVPDKILEDNRLHINNIETPSTDNVGSPKKPCFTPKISSADTAKKNSQSNVISSMILTQSESKMLDEFLSGVELDDF